MTTDLKAGVTVSELTAWADALSRVFSAVEGGPPMFFGGPTPGNIISAVEEAMRSKIMTAAPGAILTTETR